MINDSIPEYLFIRVCIVTLRTIGPLCILYSLARPFVSTSSRVHIWLLPLDVYAAIEAAFLLFVYLPLRASSQQPTIHPPLTPKALRKTLFERCMSTTHQHVEYLKQWFRDAEIGEIRKQNVAEFFAWAFLNKASSREHSKVGEMNVADETSDPELEEYVRVLERKTGYILPDGYGNAKGLRLTLDEVRMAHRPFLWYLIVFLVDVFTHVWLSFNGFKFYRMPLNKNSSSIFPPRPQTLVSGNISASSRLSYWYRPHLSDKHRPILFLHGIGIGLSTYVPFFRDLNAPLKSGELDADIGILAIELLPISFRITTSLPRREQFCAELAKILESHQEFANGFALIAHSYGSVLATHILSSQTSPNLRDLVKSITLVDPVSTLLHLPDVAYNFTYRSPRTASQWQLWYFASTDMGVAHTLARGFFWSENILWKEDCAHLPVTVFLAGQDIISPTGEVCAYLTEDQASEAGKWAPGEWDERHIIWRTKDRNRAPKTVMWCEGLNHAQVFDRKSWRRMLVTEARRISSTVVE